MKNEKEIYEQYNKYPLMRPWFFGKEEHWKTYYEGYEMGYQDAAKESLDSLIKRVGMDLEKFPLDTEKQFDVMKEALQKYYEKKK